jgi:hypothetical protein
MEVANPSSQDRTPRCAIVLAVSSAAAPYRASGLVPWHETEVARWPLRVRCWGNSGSRISGLSLPFLDPLRTSLGRGGIVVLTRLGWPTVRTTLLTVRPEGANYQ